MTDPDSDPDVDPDADPEEARRTVRRRYGADLAAKATDRFCVAVRRRADVGGDSSFGLEAAPSVAGVVPLATIVQFAEPERAVPSPPRGGLRPALRQSLIQATRTASYQAVGRVYDEIESLSDSALGPGREVLGAPQVPTLVNQVCWLNRTVRTYAGPEALADVVAEDVVTAVDVPRRILADADTVNHRTIGLPRFLASNPLTGAGILVAVIDSEVAFDHPALKGRVVHRRNYTREPWGNPHRHGTAVAGIIAADDPDDGGVAPGATVYNYKVLARGRGLNGDNFEGALAIQQALEDGMDVANCSWGAGFVRSRKSLEARAVETAWALGMAVVKSAGNAGPAPATMTTPADADTIIVVGATDLAGSAVQDYSSRGPAGARPGPDVVAPGGGADGNLACCLVTGSFGDAGFGTSYAAPHVSGILALWLESDPALAPDQLRERLRAGARRLAVGGPEAQGEGLVQLT